MRFDAETIKPHIGAIVHADRDALNDAGTIARCLELLDERTVLVFPGLGLSDAEQLAFTDKLGARVYYASNVPGGVAADADVYKITLDPEVNTQPDYVHSTFFWHFDGAHGHIAPPKATLLGARRVARRGGQTEFANTYAAYENLPDAEKAELEGLRTRHSIIAAMRPFVDAPTEAQLASWRKAVLKSREPAGAGAAVSPAAGSADEPIEKEHPLVWTHQSGRKSLVLGVTIDRVVDMPMAEGRALLSRLLEWSVQPDFTYRHDWRDGDLVILNNPGALHRVIPYDEQSGRAVHRTTVAGVEFIN